MNPKSLKGTRGRVLTWLTRPDGRTHDIGKLPGTGDSPSLPSSNNRLCNLFSKPLFTIVPDDLCQFGLIDRVQPLRQRQAGTAIHAHVQRRIETKGKTTLGLIQLWRGHTEIDQDAVHGRDAKAGQVIGPFQVEGGWALVKVEDRRPEQPITLEAARPQIVRFLTYDQVRDLLEKLRGQAKVQTFLKTTPDVPGQPREPATPATKTEGKTP